MAGRAQGRTGISTVIVACRIPSHSGGRAEFHSLSSIAIASQAQTEREREKEREKRDRHLRPSPLRSVRQSVRIESHCRAVNACSQSGPRQKEPTEDVGRTDGRTESRFLLTRRLPTRRKMGEAFCGLASWNICRQQPHPGLSFFLLNVYI